MGKNDGYDLGERMKGDVKSKILSYITDRCREGVSTPYSISDARGGNWCFAKQDCIYQSPVEGESLPVCLKPHFVAMENARKEQEKTTRARSGDTTMAMTTIAYPKEA